MSVVNRHKVKLVLPRDGTDDFWRKMWKEMLAEGTPQQQWRRRRYLAMLALRENAGWPVELIGDLFGHPKGHVGRCLRRIKQEIRDRYRMNPDFLGLPDSEAETEA